jgi:two-component system NarL family response regulator
MDPTMDPTTDPMTNPNGGNATSGRSLRVLIVEDHSLFRHGLHLSLEREPDIDVVGEAADGQEAIEVAQELVPDVILMDVRMPRLSGTEATAVIKELLPSVEILMLTISEDEQDLFDAVNAGALGYLLKEVSIEEVADAVRAVAAGQSRLAPAMASKLLFEFSALSRRAADPGRAQAPHLTVREMEVLREVAKGSSNREIASELYISENTVKNHVRNILEKLHVHSRMEAVVYAVREKLLEIT